MSMADYSRWVNNGVTYTFMQLTQCQSDQTLNIALLVKHINVSPQTRDGHKVKKYGKNWYNNQNNSIKLLSVKLLLWTKTKY